MIAPERARRARLARLRAVQAVLQRAGDRAGHVVPEQPDALREPRPAAGARR